MPPHHINPAATHTGQVGIVTYRRGTQWGLDTAPEIDWRQRAACRSHDPEMWTLAKKSDPAAWERNKQAVDICDTVCPVQVECLTWALDTEPVGVIYAGIRFNIKNSLPRCGICGQPYTPRIQFQQYCSRNCGQEAHRRKSRERRRKAANA